MNTCHEYSISNYRRAKTGFYIGILSTIFSSLIITAAGYALNILDIQGTTNMRIVAIPTSITTIYGFLYYLFNNFLWKTSIGKILFKIPNLSGKWLCTGVSDKNVSLDTTNDMSIKKINWNAEIIISQQWDKILIQLNTSTSTSSSFTAAIQLASGNDMGHELTYMYHNTPHQSAPHDMKEHDGFCRLIFKNDLLSAQGGYFTNARDRISHGTMQLQRQR